MSAIIRITINLVWNHITIQFPGEVIETQTQYSSSIISKQNMLNENKKIMYRKLMTIFGHNQEFVESLLYLIYL